MNLEHISILKDLVKETISPIKGDIMHTLKKGTINKLGDILDIQNIRMYLSNISGRRLMEIQIVGDSSIWKEIDITKIKSDLALYKQFYFFKIKYTNDNGRFITMGYLGLHHEKYITKQKQGLLELFCLIYGDYIRKRILVTIQSKTKQQFPNIFKIAYSGGKAGTIITKCQNIFHRSTNSYASYYMVYDEGYLFVEYVKLMNSGGAFFPKVRKIKISVDFINNLEASNRKFFMLESGDSILKELLYYLEKYDNKIEDDYLFFFYPAKNDGQVIGVWFFLFSNKQYLNEYELESLINIADPLIKRNYKYIYQRRTNKMIVNPIFKNRDTKIDVKKVFVIMPFTLDWSNRIWQNMIKPTVENKGLSVIRADDLYGRDIMEDVWSGILSSKFIIADITGRNPNVFYELGIAHCLGKEVIIITQNKDDIPFDLNRYRHIIYQDNYDGYELLKNKLAATIDDLLK